MNARLLSLLLIGTLLSAGCITVELTHKVERNGDSFISERVDLSALLAAADKAGEAAELPAACGNVSADDPSLSCNYAAGILTVNKSVRLSEGLYLFNRTSEFPYAFYTLEVRKLPQLINPDGLDSGDVQSMKPQSEAEFSDPASKLSAAALRTAGAKITYDVEMPGEIVSAEGGEVVEQNGKKLARFDVVDLMSEGRNIVVVSKELDLLMVFGAAAAVALLVGGIAVIFVIATSRKR